MLRLFFSYSHRDEKMRDELEVHLSMLKRQGIIETWHDRRIGAGKDIHGEISEHLENSSIILLLVSPYFLASDYCYDVEMKRAIQMHEAGAARVVPVILEPCDWQPAPFGPLRATPPDGKPISKYPNIHDAFLAVTTDIRAAAEDLADVSSDQPDRKSAKEDETVVLVEQMRSSNLRVKQSFSDQDRDEFLDESFEHLANYFENSLNELAARNTHIDTRFRRIDKDGFSAAIYASGEKESSCRIWRGGSAVGDIGYSIGEDRSEGSYNEALSVVDDGHSLLLRPLGLRLLGQSGREALTREGAAEYLWSILLDPLQR